MTANLATRSAFTKSNLMAAHNQWASRPDDERYWNLADLMATIEHRNARSAERDMRCGELTAVARNGDLCIMGKAGIPAQLTHWSFDQLAKKIEAPASYLRTLPVAMSADLVNHGLKRVNAEDSAQLLIYHENRDADPVVRAITTDYTRLWNGQIVSALLRNGLQNGWMTPPARPAPGSTDPRAREATGKDIIPGQENFGLAVKEGDMIAPAGVYEGDRDMFLFLVNPTRIIDDGGMGLMRGVFIWNSEVGGGAFSVQTFLLENVCGNHICWGASKVANFRMIHRGDNIKKFAPRIMASLQAAQPTDLRPEEKMIQTAKARILGKDRKDVVETIYGRKTLSLAKRDVEAAYDWAIRYEHTALSAPTTAWGFVHGLTRYSQTMKYADQRDALDTVGGKILEWATVS